MFRNKKVPDWFLDLLKSKRSKSKVSTTISKFHLHTVCDEARCPNRGECFSKGTATFLLLGDKCTRDCKFCAIESSKPEKIDKDEPERVLKAVKEMGLKYVVLTSVTRDDLSDGGAAIFAETVKKIKNYDSKILIEVLTPDFLGNTDDIETVMDSKPDVYNHNLETIKRLYDEVRPSADYERSLNFLKNIKKVDSKMITKSGIMVGLGEKPDEVIKLIGDLKEVKCDILTIGQYIQPTANHYPVKEYVNPEQYKEYEGYGEKIGINIIASPLVRSSYLAHEVYDREIKKMK